MDRKKLIERLIPVVTGTNWDRLEDYLVDERKTLIENLIKSSDIKQINKLQGEISRIDSLLSLPNTVKKVATSY